MRRRLQKMVSASSSIASGHAAYASRRRPSIDGSRTWLPAQSYADGSGMTRADGSSSAGDTRLSSHVKLNSSASFGRSRERIRSRSSLRLATSCITKPSYSGTFLQVESERRRRAEAYPNVTGPFRRRMKSHSSVVVALIDTHPVCAENLVRLTGEGITKPIAPRSPWQNGFAERLIESIQRECVDHVIALGEAHLCGILQAYACYYND